MPRIYLLWFSLGLLFLCTMLSEESRALFTPAQAGETCAGAPQERFDVNVRTETPPPKVNHNLNRVQLGSMAFHGMTDSILGLHIHGIKIEYRAKHAAEPDGNGYCFWIRSIDVLLRYDAPDIYIAKDYRRGSCNYKAILGHEKRHEIVAREVIKRYIPRFRSLFTSLLIPKPKSAILVSSREDGKRKTEALLMQIIQPVYKEFESALAKEQAEVDALREYRKVLRQCKRW